MVRRIYVEKKPGLRQEARGLLHELQTVVGVSALEDLRLLNRYAVFPIRRVETRAKLFPFITSRTNCSLSKRRSQK